MRKMAKNWKRPLFLAFVLIPILLSLSLSVSLSSSQVEQRTLPTIDYKAVVSNIDMSAIEGHVRYLSSLGTRMTAYPGGNASADYIHNFLNSLPGLQNVSFYTYRVVVPASFGPYGANITVLSPTPRTVEAYALRPNSMAVVNTGKNPLQGPLVYVGKGNLEDFDSKAIDGSIVLMDFNSRQHWLRAADLGAKAVIYIEPLITTRTEADMKFTYYAPAAFPRLYVKAEDGAWLITQAQAGAEVQVQSNQQWLYLPARNVVAYLPGTEHPELTIILTAYFDTYGVVPLLSPGASEAFGIGTLLELARYFSQNRPKLSILFLAFSGLRQWGAGAREWIDEHFFNKWYNVETGRKAAILQSLTLGVDLDINPDTDIILAVNTGKLYNEQLGTTIIAEFKSSYFIPMGAAIQKGLGKEFELWPNQFNQMRSPFDDNPVYEQEHIAETLLCTGLPAFTFTTAYSWRNLLDTPIDTYENLSNLDKIRTQIEFISCAIATFANDPNLRNHWSSSVFRDFPLSYQPTMTRNLGFFSISGRMVIWNVSTAFYSPIKNALVHMSAAYPFHQIPTGMSYEYVLGMSRNLIVKTDENGVFRIPGWSTTAANWYVSPRGFVINSTGHILYAPDFGRYQILDYYVTGKTEPSRTPWDVGPWAVFKAGSITLYNVRFPGLRTSGFVSRATTPYMPLTINDVKTHTPLDSFSVFPEYMGNGWIVAVAFVMPDKDIEILFGPNKEVFLINATEEEPFGTGYRVRQGQQMVIKNPVLRSLESIYLINRDRVQTLRELKIKLLLVELHERVGEELRLINYALSPKGGYRYTTALNLTYHAKSLEQGVYLDIFATTWDTATTVPYFAGLLVIFVFLAERIFISAKGYKRIAALLAIYLTVLALFWTLHPGFKIAATPAMVLFGIATGLLVLPLFITVYNRTQDALKEIRRGELGVHYAEAERFGAFMESISLGTENMRRRKLRTSLTLVAITLMIMSLTLFTSISPIEIVSYQEVPIQWVQGWPPFPYTGIHIKIPMYGGANQFSSITEQLVEWLKVRYGGTVAIAPRFWLYTTSQPTLAYFLLTNQNGTREDQITSILGLTPEEAQIRDIRATVDGGWWFEPGQDYVCLLSNTTAQKLGVQRGDKISLMGIQLTVLGIFNPHRFGLLYDLDQEPIAPVHIAASNAANSWEPAVHDAPQKTLIIPYELALSLSQRPHVYNGFWGSLAGVSLSHFQDEAQLKAVAEDISKVLAWKRFLQEYYILATVGNKILRYDRALIQSLYGLTTQTVLITLVLLICFNIMLGAVQERISEISTYSSLGLSPSQVSFMFITENAVYGLVGCTLGYVAAMLLSAYILPPEMSPNYASGWVITAIQVGILVTLASALYPAYKASRLVTPSLERKFKITTKPLGDQWEIPLPFIAETEDEAEAILAYLAEYVDAHLATRPVAAEAFAAEGLEYTKEERAEKKIRTLHAKVHLIPFDRNVRQTARFITLQGPDGRQHFTLSITRESGTIDDWTKLNRDFVNTVRKQLLMWRAIKPKERQEYTETREARLQKITKPQ